MRRRLKGEVEGEGHHEVGRRVWNQQTNLIGGVVECVAGEGVPLFGRQNKRFSRGLFFVRPGDKARLPHLREDIELTRPDARAGGG